MYLLIIFLVLAVMLSVYYYRYTVPPIAKKVRNILVILRSLSLLLLLLLFFDLIVTLSFSDDRSPQNLLFVDDSHSIVANDSLQTTTQIKELVEDLTETNGIDFTLYKFGRAVELIDSKDFQNLAYEQNSTNLEEIFSTLKKTDNIASVTIISDGIITTGKNPIISAEGLNYPVFTVGVGDTIINEDIKISQINHPDFLYANKNTPIDISVYSNIQSQTASQIELYEDNQLVESKRVELAPESITNLSINYLPVSEGIKNMRLIIRGKEGEVNLKNNIVSFSMEVLDDKIDIAIISGAPSPDLSFMIKALEEEERVNIIKFIESEENKFTLAVDLSKIEKVDVILMSGFPSHDSSPKLINDVKELIKAKKLPYLFHLTNSVDPSKLNSFSDILSFTATKTASLGIKTNAVVKSANILSQSLPTQVTWNSLPPVNQADFSIVLKIGSGILLSNNKVDSLLQSPLVSTSLYPIKSVSFYGFNFWKWKLQNDEKSFYNNFISTLVIWLSTDSDMNKLKVSRDKDIYRVGDDVVFSANLYNDLLSPMANAEIQLRIKTENSNETYRFENSGNGNYSLNLSNLQEGKYNYKINAVKDERQIAEASGSFNIEPVSAEEIDLVMNKSLLQNISHGSGGNFYYIGSTKGLREALIQNPLNVTETISSESNIDVKQYSISLIIILVFFSLEWYLRKKYGLN